MEDSIGFTDDIGDCFPPHPLDGEKDSGKYIPILSIQMLMGLVKLGKRATDDDLLDVGVPRHLLEKAKVEFKSWVSYIPQSPSSNTSNDTRARPVANKPQLSLANMIKLYRIYSTSTNDQVGIYNTIKNFKSVDCNHIALREWIEWVLYEPKMDVYQSSK